MRGHRLYARKPFHKGDDMTGEHHENWKSLSDWGMLLLVEQTEIRKKHCGSDFHDTATNSRTPWEEKPMRSSSCSRDVGRRFVLVGAVLGLWLLLGSGSAFLLRAAETSPAKGRQRAILIAAEKYHRARHLRYTTNDVKQLARTLSTRGHFQPDNILEMTDTASNPRFRPLRANIMTELPKWLKKAEAEDQVLVYFSVHGFIDKDRKLYLAPIDCDPANPAATGIEVRWLREQIARCRARFKLLVIDACHAGSEKGDDESTGVTAKELAEPFGDLADVVTLASSTSRQTSQIWEEKQQSLFSYWLNQGLRGHADGDGNGEVSIDELYDYVYRYVTKTAKLHFPKEQTPVRIIRPGNPGVPVVVRLKPHTLKGLLADVSEQLATAMLIRKLSKVGVLEFSTDTAVGEILGGDFGLLGRYCAVELERRLIDRSAGKFAVVDRRRLQDQLKVQHFGLDDLGAPDALNELSQKVGGMPVIVLGTLRNRVGRTVTLQCRLVETATGELAGVAAGTAMLNESEWAMVGRSTVVKPEDYRPQAPQEDVATPEVGETVIERLDRRSQGPHPMLDPKFPYRVKIAVDLQERKAVFRGNNMYVPLRKGEVYEVGIENHGTHPVFMRLLVDGLNTLPEKLSTKAVTVEPTKQEPVYRPAQRVNLAEARAWWLDHATQDKQGKTSPQVYAVRGFFSQADVNGKYRAFKVADAQQSLAARKQFTDQIGLITAAFYQPTAKRGSRSLGTTYGPEYDEQLDIYEGDEIPGKLVGVVHIHYVEPEVLEGLLK